MALTSSISGSRTGFDISDAVELFVANKDKNSRSSQHSITFSQRYEETHPLHRLGSKQILVIPKKRHQQSPPLKIFLSSASINRIQFILLPLAYLGKYSAFLLPSCNQFSLTLCFYNTLSVQIFKSDSLQEHLTLTPSTESTPWPLQNQFHD